MGFFQMDTFDDDPSAYNHAPLADSDWIPSHEASFLQDALECLSDIDDALAQSRRSFDDEAALESRGMWADDALERQREPLVDCDRDDSCRQRGASIDFEQMRKVCQPHMCVLDYRLCAF